MHRTARQLPLETARYPVLDPISLMLASGAIVLPALLAYNAPPSATFLNQALALLAWGAFMTWVLASAKESASTSVVAPVGQMLFALVLLACSALVSCSRSALPLSLAMSSAGLILSAAVVLVGAASLRSAEHRTQAHVAFCVALVLAGAISLVIALIQFFAPSWADGTVIAHAATPGRVGGNLRQPNHLSSLLLWSIAALVWLHDAFTVRQSVHLQRVVHVATAVLTGALVFGTVLTASRTGTVCIILLALWGVVDKHLSRFSRVLLWLTPLIYVLCWGGVSEWAPAFAGGDQLHKSDLSSSRFAIWANALSLIGQNPWFGVGWGEFNFAWTLTPFPGRPTAFFDHTHNLPLQLLVELGIPLGSLVLALLAWALWKAFAACLRASEPDVRLMRTAFAMVLMMVVHSMLEYPLWYAYFLLPTAFAFGICLGHSGEDTTEASSSWGLRQTLVVASIVLFAGAIASVIDYRRVVAIFVPPEDASPLPVRIAEGQRSWFFAYHADYAEATISEHPSQVMGAFGRASHYLLDTRLMLAWARAYNESGDVERARYIADRLREFHNPDAESFFAECNKPRSSGEPLPFQCTPATKHFTYEDFRMR